MIKKGEQYHHGDLRTALVSVAADMIGEAGVEAVTMRALSERIGVSRTAAYRHFRDKSALLAAVAQEGFEQLLLRLQAASNAAGGDVLARLQAMGVAYILFAVEHPTHYRLMFTREADDHAAFPPFGAAARAVFDALLSTIEAGQSERAIRDGDARALAQVTWALVHGQSSLLIDRQIRGTIDPQQIARLATGTLIHGLVPERGRQGGRR